MSLRRRVLLVVLIGTPIVWALALVVSLQGAAREIHELFDTQQVRLARTVATLLTTLDASGTETGGPGPSSSAPGVPIRPAGGVKETPTGGPIEFDDFALVVWDRHGRLQVDEQDNVQLPWPGDAGAGSAQLLGDGFRDFTHQDAQWRAYYLRVPQTGHVIGVGQNLHERTELERDLLIGQALPWLLMLAALLIVLSIAIRRAMAPVEQLAADIESRPSSDLSALETSNLPRELLPLVLALNRLFIRVEDSIERDRRFTADAAHELRTPLAATRAQWDVATGATDPARRREAAANVTRGLARMSVLVSQLLALAHVDAVDGAVFDQPIDWSRTVEQALEPVLALADARQIELGVDWQVEPQNVLPVVGHADLLVAALRNLVDNAVRYAPAHSRVTVVCGVDRVLVDDEGQGLPAALLPRLGERFFRAGGQETDGSGLGLSIVARIAALHALRPVYENRPQGGFRAGLARGH